MCDLLKNRCRLCSNVNRRLIEIDNKLTDCLFLLYRLQILNSAADDFPKTICAKCLASVKNSWKFYQNVQKSQKRLAKLLNDAVKQDDINPSIGRLASQPDSNYNNILHVEEYGDAELVKDTNFISNDGPKSMQLLKIDETLTENDEESPQKHWTDYPWICNDCKAQYTDFREYKKHSCFQFFQFRERFFCADCPKTYSRLRQFFKHVIGCHRERKLCHVPSLHCHICKQWFNSVEEQESSNNELATSIKSPIIDRLSEKIKLVCGECGKQYKSKSQLKNHYRTHSGIKPFSCDECGKSFYVKGALKVHKNIHTGIKEFTCEECGKRFFEKGNLIAHISSHTSLRAFTCSVCSKPFKTSVTLREHLSIHTGAKPHSCNECGRTFRLRGQLQRHLRLHSEDKPYPCDFCHKSFRLKSVLVVHRRQHTGEQPFACSECRRRFAEWPNCHKHMKRMHGIPAKSSKQQEKLVL